MYRSLLYKEWIKMRWFVLLAAVISLVTLINMWLTIRRGFEFQNAMMLWMRTLLDQQLYYNGIRYNLVIAGVIFALVQFVPETSKRRLRLLFHLPVAHNRALFTMLGAGALALLSMVLLNAVFLWAVMSKYFPVEAQGAALLTSAPWFAAGFLTYFTVALVLLEPSRVRKIAYAAGGWGLVKLYFLGRGYCEYNHAWIAFAVILLLALAAPALPAYRFKRGAASW